MAVLSVVSRLIADRPSRSGHDGFVLRRGRRVVGPGQVLQQLAGVRVLWMVKDVAHTAALDDSPGSEDEHPVGDAAYQRQVVGHEQQAQAVLVL